MASGSIQIKSGTYYAVLNTKDANGKRKQKWISTKLEANSRNRRKAEAFLDNLLNAKSVDGDDLAEYAREWVNMIQFTTDPVTYQGYRSAAELHIIPYFEQNPIDIQDVAVRDVQRFQTFLLTRGNTKTGGPLSAKSVRNFMTVLSLMIEQGRNLKDVQVWLGHSDIQTTGNVYGHLTNKHLVEVGNQLSDTLFA